MSGRAAPDLRQSQVWHLFVRMAQKVCSPTEKRLTGAYFCLIVCSLSRVARQRDPNNFTKIAILSPAVRAARRASLKGIKCRTDPGFMPPRASSRALIRKPQFRNLIARGTVTADTLVWTEGMAGWQRAGDIPGLMSGRSGRRPCRHAGVAAPVAIRRAAIWRRLAVDRSRIYGISPGAACSIASALLLVIPAPWVRSADLSQWIVSCVQVPGRPNLAFNGQAGDIWCGISSARCSSSSPWLRRCTPAQRRLGSSCSWCLSWLHRAAGSSPISARTASRSDRASTGSVLGLSRLASAGLSFPSITIIGWAWVVHGADALDLPSTSTARIARSYSRRPGSNILWRARGRLHRRAPSSSRSRG